MSNARPFCLMTASLLRDIESQCRRSLKTWADAWLPAAADATVNAATAGTGAAVNEWASEPGLLWGDAQGSFVWVPVAARDVLAGWLFPGWSDSRLTRGQDDLVTTIADAALRALIASLPNKTDKPATHGAPTPMSKAPPRDHGMPSIRAGVPMAHIAIAHGAHVCRLWIRDTAWSHQRAKSGTAHAAPCEPVMPALRDQAVSLTVELGRIEIDIQTLYGLAQGDVIRLDTSLDSAVPLHMQGCGHSTAIRGYLGALGQHRAVEIVPDTSTA